MGAGLVADGPGPAEGRRDAPCPWHRFRSAEPLMSPRVRTSLSRGFSPAPTCTFTASRARGAAVHRSRWEILPALVATAVISSCSTTGQVFVSHPQVFTRERLVEERFRESEWARSQLSEENFAKVHMVNSGMRDFREFVGVANDLAVSVSPTAQAGSGADSTTSGAQHAAISVPGSQLDKDVRESKAEVDAIKEFEFKQAVRNKVNAAIRQVQLDDTHDLRGATLYSLQFLITVQPGRNSSEYAVVELRVRPPAICADHSWAKGFADLYERWWKASRQDARIKDSDLGPDKDKEWLWKQICDASWTADDALIADDSLISDNYYVAYVQPSEYAQKVSDVLAKEDFSRYAFSLQGMIPNTPITAADNLELVNRATELAHAATLQPLLVGMSNGRDRFGWIVGPRFAIDDGDATWKHSPTQYDVSAAISVPAWWPYLIIDGRVGWRNRDGTTDWNRAPWYRSAFLSGIRETEANSSYEVRDGDSRVDADGRDPWYFVKPRAPLWGKPLKVRLPGDMKSLTTRLLADGDRRLVAPEIKGCAGSRSPCYHLTATACSGDRVTPASDGARRGRAGEARRMQQSLYIRGAELWRNAQVYVGSQRADRVDILPDMGGIVAYFDEVVFVPRAGAHGAQRELQDLRVVTSVDEAVLLGAVAVELKRPCGS